MNNRFFEMNEHLKSVPAAMETAGTATAKVSRVPNRCSAVSSPCRIERWSF
jgi:hypothetical protein